MDTLTALSNVEEILKPWTRWAKRVQPEIIEISISRSNLHACIQALQAAEWGYLSAITGLHIPGIPPTASIEKQWNRLEDDNIHSAAPALGDSFLVLYHFCEGAAILNLRLHPPSYDDNSVPSICDLIPSATLYERELQEMFGLKVKGTPNPGRFVLSEDWPEGVYPLRKDFDGTLPDKDAPCGPQISQERS